MSHPRILIPIDFDTKIETLLSFVGKLSQKPVVTLIHYVQFPTVPGNYMQPMDYLGEMYETHLTLCQKKLDEIASNPAFKNLVVKTELISDPNSVIGEEIANYADEREIDLILLISKHRKGMESIYPGTELLRIVRYSRKPVLVLSEGQISKSGRIAFATDFSPSSAEAFRRLQPIAELLGSTLNCFRINTAYDFIDQREFVSSRNNFTNEIGIVDLPEIEFYNAWEADTGILQYAEDNLADIIALATHGRKGLNRIFNSSVTEKVLRMTTTPVLIINLGAIEKDS